MYKSAKKPRVALIAAQAIAGPKQIRKATPPFGIASLAAVLRDNGFGELFLLDTVVEGYDNLEPINDNSDFYKFGLSNSDLIERLIHFDAEIVAISALFSTQTECAIDMANDIKSKLHDIPIVLGGNHASNNAKEILSKESSIDYIIAGEADYTFLDFLEKYFNKQNFLEVQGLVWREGPEIRMNPRPAFIANLDDLPFPAFDLLPMDEYFRIGMWHNPFTESPRVGAIFTSRGCPQECVFCSVPDYLGYGFRSMSAEKVIEHVYSLVENFSIKELQILDDNFTVDYKRVIKICEGIKNLGLRICFPNGIRADRPKNHKNRNIMFKAMRDAGVVSITVTPEHGDQDYLNEVIGKRMDLSDVLATIQMAHDNEMLVHAAFMMGFPFETASLREKTANFARRIEADSYSVSLVTPLPGTPLWKTVEENNLFVDGFKVNRMAYSEVNIIPHDISTDELIAVVTELNQELNEKAQRTRPKANEKYKLIEGKITGEDRKYHYDSSMTL